MEIEVEEKWKYIQGLKEAPVAIETEKANEQHYEVSWVLSCLSAL